MIYLFDKDEKLIKIVRKSAVKTALQKCVFTPKRYVSDRLTVELKGLNADELEQVEYMAIQTMEDAHTFHYFYVAQKFSDELTTLIGVQSGIEELRKSPVYDKRPQNAFARDVITDLLAGTNWQARFVGETTPHSTNFYYISTFDALKKVCDVWDLEMQFFVEMNGNRIGGRYIDFKQRIGEAVGKRVVYGHNALQILQEVERTNIFTALIGRGKGEETSEGYGRKITFENIVWSRTQGKPVDKPAGQKYLELPLMTRQYGIKNADGSMRPKIGFVDFSEEENPEILIERTYKALIDAARPQLTLKTSSVYLKGVKVGDTIRVVRHDKKLDYDTRIFEITFNRLNNQSSDIKLGDRIGESNEAKVQTIADKAVEQFVNNEFSNFVQNLPDYLPSADGFNNNWYGAEDPTVKYSGKVLINDIWYKPDQDHEGHKIMLRWTGEVWEEILRTYESEALRDRIAEEIAQVNTSMQAQSEEHDRQVADILSKTQSIESLANQAKSDAANAITQALQSKDEAIANATAQVATVETKVNQLINEVSSKVSQTDYNTLTGRVSSAETAITQNATEISKRLTSTQVEQAISAKGYATTTALDNKVKETADSFSRTISETKALIPVDTVNRNLLNTNNATPATILYGTETYPSPSGSSVGPDNSTIKTAIWVDVGAKYTFSKITKSGKDNFWRVSYLDSNYAYVGRFAREENVFTITIPANVKYLWVSYPDDAQCKIEKGDKATPFVLSVNDTATVTALNNVTDTVDSHTRTIGAVGTTGSILDNVSKVTQTAAGLVQEVSGTNGLKTQVSTLAGSYAIKNLTNSGTVLNQINLNKDGSVKIDGSLVQITGTTYIQDGVITSAKIAGLDAGKITAGTLSAARIAVNSIDGSKLVFDQAFFNGLTANEAYLKQLFAKNAFITQVQAVTLSANNIAGGILTATNGAMEVNLNAGQILYYTDQAALKRILSGYPTQFVKFETGTVTGKGRAGVTVIGSNRYGTESSNDGGFVGIRAWNGTNIDQIDVAGDTVRLASSTFDSADGWNVVTLPNKLEIDAYNSNHRASSRVKIGDVWLWKNSTTYSSMRDTINLIIDNLQLLHTNKTTEKSYSYTMPPKV